MQILDKACPDPTALDKLSKYFDPGSDPANPRWYLVEVKFKKQFRRIITLTELREHRTLQEMNLLKKGSRLSVMPVTKKQWDYILGLE